MKNVLLNYSQEEIEQLALKQLEIENKEDNNLKIVKIDKEYKKHNIKSVTKALANASIILFGMSIVMNSNTNMSEININDIIDFANNMVAKLPFLSQKQEDIVLGIYSKMFDGLSNVISELGLIGIILVSKSIRLVSSITKDTVNGIKMKKELEVLKNLVENAKVIETNRTK